MDIERYVEQTFVKKVRITVQNEVQCIVSGLHPDHIEYFVNEYSMYEEGYFFRPKYKLGVWDGKKKFFTSTGHTYVYLLDQIIPKVKSFGYKIELNDKRVGVFEEVEQIDTDYFSHVIDPKTDEPFEVRPYQVDALNSLLVDGFGIVIAGTGAGKAQPLTSKVLTPSGWVNMGDVVVGSEVLTPNGIPSTVIGVYPQGEKKIYELTFHDGSKAKCCEDHLWKVYRPKKLWHADTQEDVVDTKYIINFLNLKDGKQRHVPGNITIPLVDPIPGEVKDLPVDPYLLGVLIGDGSLSTGSIGFSSKDEQLIKHITYVVDVRYGLSVTSNNKNGSCDYRIVNKLASSTFPPQKNVLMEKIKELNLNKKSKDKFIPQLYMSASIEQRWDLIRGLMDTDGTVDKKGNLSFTTTSEVLANDVQKLCWSLGSTATISSKIPTFTYKGEKKNGTRAFTVFIRHPSPSQFFKLERKKQRCRMQHCDGRIQLGRRIVSVVEIGHQPAQCIMIDDDNHLYITDDYVVTHNTTINAALVDVYGKKGLRTITIVPNVSLISQTVTTFIGYGLDTGQYSGETKDTDHTHVVSTWQALQNNPKLVSQFQVLVVDECQGAKARTIGSLINDYGKNIAHRFGLTGTLPKHKADATTITTSLGPIRFEIPAHELIAGGWLSVPNITILQLNDQARLDELMKENSQLRDDQQKITYDSEINFLQQDKVRMRWIADFIIEKGSAHKGNVLCLVGNVSYGKKLTKLIPGATFLHGKDDQNVRQQVYDLFETHDDMIVIATVQIAGVGLSINRIFNLIYIDGGKSFVRTIQTIGRGLRKGKDKDSVDVVDICGNLEYSRKHLTSRVKYYKEARYKHKKVLVNYASANSDFV